MNKCFILSIIDIEVSNGVLLQLQFVNPLVGTR
jgi:hypothetical protein